MAKSRERKKRNGARKPRGNLKEAILLIPLTYNDGTRVPRQILESICDELLAAFDGWTIEGKVTGAYRMRTGEKRVEELQRISVILEESRVPELEAMMARWGALLGQETMLMRIADFIVKFVLPQPEK